jgi:hypothetical protein
MSAQARRSEIEQALDLLEQERRPPAICVVPVRMTEAWFLFDRAAIRRAAGNPNGRMDLDVPELRRCEALPDPKSVLRDLLVRASGLSGRRLRSFQSHNLLARVSEVVQDFSPLRALSAFQKLEEDIIQVVSDQRWNQ